MYTPRTEHKMAEFKLGRIRFIWKDAWASSNHSKDDVIHMVVELCMYSSPNQDQFPQIYSTEYIPFEPHGKGLESTFYKTMTLLDTVVLIFVIWHTAQSNTRS